ncbi:MAG TPA: HlyD family type I secretion periplasmic adaptor subunit [Acetobacteraceae bacterium]|nr:HlyD family type I secretion periplasmic adaptor subunit [Acetobacteraceae bacterium]
MTQLVLRPSRALQTEPRELLEFEPPTAALINVPVRGAARGVVLIVSALVVSLVVVAAVLPMERIVSSPGLVVSRQRTVVVEALETSVVRSVLVREGELVHAGDLLARLDPTFSGSDATMYSKQMASLQAWVDRLHAELARREYRPKISTPDTVLQEALFAQRKAAFDFQVQEYDQKIASYQAQAAQSAADMALYQKRLGVAIELERKRRELEQMQVGSQIDLLTATDNRIEISRNLADAVATHASAIKTLAATVSDRDYYVQNWYSQASQDLRDQSSALSDAKENFAKADLRRHLVDLRADQDAYVMSIARISDGSVVQSGDNLVTLVPASSPLEVEADIDGNEAGFVRVGQKVSIKFDTFNFVKHGAADGTVRNISPGSFTTTGDLSQVGSSSQAGGQTVSPYYKARISVRSVNLQAVPKGFHLVPGMPVHADIQVGTRTVLEYLLDRVMPAFHEGMREPD